MGILDTYRKQTASPLKSITIKLEENQIDAIRAYEINLGAMVRDILNDSDLMQKYNSDNCITNTPAEAITTVKDEADDIFNENQLKFTYKGRSYYYADAKTMFEKNAEGTIAQITKHSYYKHQDLFKKEQ